MLRANWPAVELFAACETQWRRAGARGLPVGLDYAGLRAALELMCLRPSRELFHAVTAIEDGALAELARRRGA